jgi:hypothetical protein
MGRIYHYAGPHHIQWQPLNNRACILRPSDVLAWVDENQEEIGPDHSVTVTFVVDTSGQLWIASRRSEHVICAAGQPVRMAGEMTFTIAGQRVRVSEVTNQSTGYCPEPESWSAVAAVLDTIGFERPPDFTTAYIFRRCDTCGATNIVKDDFFVCGVCDAALGPEWNFDST